MEALHTLLMADAEGELVNYRKQLSATDFWYEIGGIQIGARFYEEYKRRGVGAFDQVTHELDLRTRNI